MELLALWLECPLFKSPPFCEPAALSSDLADLVEFLRYVNVTTPHGYGISRSKTQLQRLFMQCGTGTHTKKINVCSLGTRWYGLVRVMVRVRHQKRSMFPALGTGGTGIYP